MKKHIFIRFWDKWESFIGAIVGIFIGKRTAVKGRKLTYEVRKVIIDAFYRRKILLVSLAFLIIALPIAYLTLKYQPQTKAAWYDDSWPYRKSVQVTNNTSAQSNVYISLTIDTSDTTKFKSNCGDLRFTHTNGKLLPYFIVSGCQSASTVVHVFLQNFPASAQTYYYYYGNLNIYDGFAAADFSTQASNYTVGTIGSEEKSEGPVAYWKFDEGYGTQTKDSTQSGDNGSISNATWQPEDQCVNGKCLYFNGSNSSVTVSTVNNIKFDQPHTFSAWFTYRGFQTGNNGGKGGLFTTTGGPRIYTADSSSNALCLQKTVSICTGNLQDNTWYHYAYTWDGTTARIYINGIQVNSGAITLTAISNLTIGYTQWYHKGIIDDVKIYPYARTAAQVKADYNTGLARQSSVKGTVASMGSSPKSGNYLSQGLVGYWKMDEASWNGTANEVIDSSGNGYHGVGVGTTPPTTTAGIFGNGGLFDGVDDSVNIGTTLTFTGQFSLAFWFNKTDSLALRTLISRNAGSSNKIFFNTDNTLGIRVVSNLASQNIGYTAGMDGSWHHLAVTRDSSNVVKAYLDGGSPVTLTTESGTSYWEVIGRTPQDSQNWKGKLDEVRAYNRALSPKEISDLYNWAPGPVLYYNFEEKSGTTVNDISGNGLSTSAFVGNTTWSSGKFGSALYTDGNGDSTYRNDTTNSPIDLPNNLSITFWLKVTTLNGAYRAIITKGDTGIDKDNNYECWIDTSNRIYCAIGNTSNMLASTTYTLSPNTWYHVGFTVDGSYLKLYINGVSTTPVSQTINPVANDNKLTINGLSAGNYSVPGYIDELKIYNYARSTKQIVEDMNAGHPAGGSPVGSQVGYWKFDEGYGTTINNSVSTNSNLSGNFGVGSSAPTWTNNGKYGKGLNFNTNQYITIADPGTSSALDMTSAITLSAWIKTTQTAESYITAKNDDSFYFSINTTANKLCFYLNNVSPLSWQCSNTSVNDGNWHYVAAAYDGSNRRLYIDGVLDKTTATTGTIAAGNSNMVIGARYNNGTYGFNGIIDEVKIYNSALTTDEIKLDYNKGAALVLGSVSDTSGLTGGQVASNSASAAYCIPGDTTSCNPPVGEWNFEEGAGNNAYDTSGNGNAGTLTNSPSWTQGKSGKGLDFSAATNEVVSVTPNGTTLDLTSTGTIEAWVYTTSFNSWNIIAARGNWAGGLNNYSLYYQNSDNQIYGEIADALGVNRSYIASARSKLTNGWHHIAFTWDGSFTRIYLDSNIAESARAQTRNASPTGNLGLGNIAAGGYNYGGIVDQVKIYNYARTQAQITYDYNRGQPVGWWKFNEGQGTNIYDSSGFTNNGNLTIGSSAPQTTAGTTTSPTDGTGAWYNGRNGKYSSSMSFDGIDDYVDIGSQTVLNNLADYFTVSAWVKTSVGSGVQTIIGRGNDWRLIKSTNTYQFEHRNVSNNIVYPAGANTSTGWLHIVGTFDKDAGYARLYINGILIDSKAQTGTTRASQTQNQIGNNYAWHAGGTYNDYWWNGQIDDVKLYNYTLTANQIKQLYNEGGGVRFGQ